MLTCPHCDLASSGRAASGLALERPQIKAPEGLALLRRKAVLTQGLAGRRPSKQGSDLTYSGALIPKSTAISPGCAVQPAAGPPWPLAGPRASLRNEGTSIAAEPRPSATPTPRGRRLRGSPWRPPHRARPRPPGASLFPPPTGRGRKKPASGRGETRPPPPENTEAPRGGTSDESCRDGGSGSSRRRAAWRPERGRAREGRAGRSDRRREATMEARGQPQSPAADRMSQGDSNPAATPHIAEDVQGDGRWMSQHSRFVLDCKDKEPDVLFVGDSMVQLLQQYEIWRELFSPLHALNFGIGGDTTGHVLWRLKNGELENIKPKVIVVWVGTNNHENTAEEVAGGIEAIVRLINTQQPQAKIIVLGLLPRGEKPNPLRQKNSKVNQLLKTSLPKLAGVQLLDVDGGFVHSDGTISCHDMFDFLHLTGAGYTKICKPLHELIMQLLEETPEEKQATLA